MGRVLASDPNEAGAIDADEFLSTDFAELAIADSNNDRESLGQWTRVIPPEKMHIYVAFRHFWRNGFYISPGANFGGHFLVYTGASCVTPSLLLT